MLKVLIVVCFRSGLKWDSAPGIFHRNVGRNIEWSRAVATRLQGWNYGIVATKDPVLTGQMLRVTVLATEPVWKDGLVSLVSVYCSAKSMLFGCIQLQITRHL